MRPWFKTVFVTTGATVEEISPNREMSAVRKAVEWSYKEIKQLWTSQYCKRGLKFRKAPIELLYKAFLLLWNFHIFLYAGGQTDAQLDVSPPFS